MTLRKPRWDLSKLIKFEKNFYTPHPAVVNRPRVGSYVPLGLFSHQISYFKVQHVC
jgi:hypothetical protein